MNSELLAQTIQSIGQELKNTPKNSKKYNQLMKKLDKLMNEDMGLEESPDYESKRHWETARYD